MNCPQAVAGFVLGLIGLPFAWVGIVPLLAVAFSLLALEYFDDRNHKNRWMPATGLTLGLLGSLAYLAHYEHL